jgi:hypothetical protein
VNTESERIERAGWHLLADATTDYVALWEAIDYGDELLGSGSEEQVISTLRELLENSLIEFFYQEPPRDSPTAPTMKTLSTEEASAALADPQWRSHERPTHVPTLWYAATPTGEQAFSSLDAERAKQIFS